MPRNSLEEILEGCKTGDSGSYRELLNLYGKRCYSYFYRLTGDSHLSEDLLGQLFIKLVKKIGTFRGDNFDAWLFTIASNIFRDYLRAKQRRQDALDGSVERARYESTQSFDEHPQSDRLQVEMEKLDADTRELIVMRFYGQLSFKEMARIRGEPLGTTLSKLHRGLAKLKELMEQNENE